MRRPYADRSTKSLSTRALPIKEIDLDQLQERNTFPEAFPRMTKAKPGTARAAPPSIWLAAAELPRAVSEMTFLAASLAPLLHSAPRGDGHAVLVLPGLLGSDRSTAPLRGILSELGYDARPWGLGRNRGAPTIGARGELLEARVNALFEETGRKVSLVGWSLGGVFARLLARRFPDRIRQIITLGSPSMTGGDATNAGKLFELASGTRRNDPTNLTMLAELSGPSRVPSTAVYSRSDGICSWKVCRETRAARSESIEVYGSHCGLGINPSVIYAVADRLGQAEGTWMPFEPRGWASWAFPTVGHA